MDENINPIKKRLSEQLPTHSPNAGSWECMSAKLDALGAEAAFQEKIEHLPQHSPDKDTWGKINSRLNRIAYYKTATRIALAVAASFLLFITVSRIVDYTQKPGAILPTAQQIQNDKLPVSVAKTKPATIESINKKSAENRMALGSKKHSANSKPVSEVGSKIEDVILSETAYESEASLIQMPILEEKPLEVLADVDNSNTNPISQPKTDNIDKQPEASVLQIDPISKPKSSSPVKYYTPKDPVAGAKQNHFAVAMNYLPENVNNGTDNSLFHNVDLTASYNKEKVRFNTSIGMAYSEEQLAFNMNYDIKTPVTAIGTGGHLDTLRYDVANVDSQYQGTEKHQYFTYNLGFGRRLFSFGKFSSWINAGAGFGVQVNNPDLIATTESSIKGQYNAQIISVNSDKPIYNSVNVNLVTGIDFNYAILSKLSITFAPTSRWYFKPLLTKDNQPTDELTLGFRTGLKLGF